MPILNKARKAVGRRKRYQAVLAAHPPPNSGNIIVRPFIEKVNSYNNYYQLTDGGYCGSYTQVVYRYS
jgi:hypothetical protein